MHPPSCKCGLRRDPPLSSPPLPPSSVLVCTKLCGLIELLDLLDLGSSLMFSGLSMKVTIVRLRLGNYILPQSTEETEMSDTLVVKNRSLQWKKPSIQWRRLGRLVLLLMVWFFCAFLFTASCTIASQKYGIDAVIMLVGSFCLGGFSLMVLQKLC